MESTSSVAIGLAGKLHTTSAVFVGGVAVGFVTHGKGISCSPLVKKSGALIVDRVTCQHAGMHVLLKKTAFNTDLMSHDQFMTCMNNCGRCYKK